MRTVLGNGILDGVHACVAFAGDGLSEHLRGLGAEVVPWPSTRGADETADERAAAAATSLPRRLDLLVVDSGELFAGAGSGDDLARLRGSIDDAFVVVRAVANAAWIEPGRDGGRIVLIAPAEGSGMFARAAGAAVENTARTLSTEWARHGIRVVAIVPRAGAVREQVCDLVAFLGSPGGEYFSGCVLRPGEVT